MSQLSIAIVGNGRMGTLVKEKLPEFHMTCAGVVGPGNASSLFEINDEKRQPINGIIDFSHPDCLWDISAYVKVHPVPLVLATTGYSDAQLDEVERLSKLVPLIHSPNYSLGIAVLTRILKELSPLLSDHWDLEIIESHHNKKLDAPSGTALYLANALNPEGKLEVVKGRSGFQKRGHEIGIHSVRGGTIAGKHEVLFAGQEELLSFTHEAHSRSIFVQGALTAMTYMSRQREPGMYSMEQVLGFQRLD